MYRIIEIVPTNNLSNTQELAMIENANNRLRRMENRLDLATKRFCLVNTDNKKVREEIDRLLVERFYIFFNYRIFSLLYISR